MKSFIKVILYLLGFPLMLAAVAIVSMPIFEAGKTYGIWIFAGLAFVALIGILYLVAGLITWNVSRKAKTLAKIRKATAALVICAVVLTTGLWFAIDMLLPDILSDATSGTITYEDIRDDYIAQGEYHGLLLDKFIELNVANKNLTKMSLAEYKAEGYRNSEVKDLIHTNFKSLDKDGFATFVGPWLDLANDDRMTVPTIVHLVINDRLESTEDPAVEDVIFIYKGEGREESDTVSSPIKWTILDMQEGALEFGLDVVPMLSGMDEGALKNTLINFLTNEVSIDMLEGLLEPILAALNNAIEDEALAGAVITIGVDIVPDSEQNMAVHDGGIVNITITPANESRGVWDYMHMAWLDSNHILFAVISLFPARRIMLFFGGIVVILSLIIGAVREKQYKRNLVEPAPEQASAPLLVRAPQGKGGSRDFSSPYLRACYKSFNQYDTRGNLNLPKAIPPGDNRKK